MKTIQFFIVFAFFTHSLFGQQTSETFINKQGGIHGIHSFNNSQVLPADTLAMLKDKGGYRYFQNRKELRFVDMMKVLKQNKEACKYAKYANTNRIFSYIFIGYAVIGTGYSLSRLAETGDMRYLLSGALVSGSYFLISIPLSKGFHKNT